VISEEPVRAYSKPALSHFLAGEITRDNLLETGNRLAPTGDNIEYILRSPVDGVDVANRCVELASTKKVQYDRLLIATGARQRIPRIPGLDSDVVRPFMTLDDADRLDRLIQPEQRALVIGGGLIGLKAAEGLHRRGMLVTVVEILPWVMPSVLDSGAGKVVGLHLKNQGIDIRTGTTVTQITTEPDGTGQAILHDGTALSFQLAVLATGVEPRTFTREMPGLDVRHGIMVDENGKTTVENVFAAGDVAEGPDPIKGGKTANLNWTSAREQGRVAGRAMTDTVSDYQGSVALNSLSFLGCPVVTMGVTVMPSQEIKSNQHELTELVDPTMRAGVYRKLVFRDDKMVGAILVGDITFSGTYHLMIRDGIDAADLGSELLTGGRNFVRRIAELRREEMEADHPWRQHVWIETPYQKKMNTHKWKRRTGQA
jgi:nitrite reductase (NADH) large subunit